MLKAKITAFMDQCANEFAMALLMPEKEYREQIALNLDEHGMVNTKAVADHFHVSITDAHMRGVSLGILRQF